MAEALTISAANLDTIERNLGAVANELSGVISNVNSVNSQVNKVEERVESLNDEVKNLVKEIQETTITTNARQSIMYNNEQIEKKFGYYDVVRRNTEALINAVETSNITIDSLYALREEIILNNPNYWLTNSLAALISWILDDKTNCDKELNNSLRINDEKTSLFFCLINLRFNRLNTSINWLNRYLSKQDPGNLSKDFVTVLDLVSTGVFGDEEKALVLDKVTNWFMRLSSNSKIKEDNVKRWEEYCDSMEDKVVTMPMLEQYSPSSKYLKENLQITSFYSHVLEDLQKITSKPYSNRKIEDILSSLIYDYEDKENAYQLDNLKNNLLIACNGDREKAEELFKKQQIIYSDKVDIVNLLTNIVIYSDEYNIGVETQKLALGLIKDNLSQAITNYNNRLYKGEIDIQINNFKTISYSGVIVPEEAKKDLNVYINNEIKDDTKDLIVTLIVLNIIGIIGIFITLKNRILSSLIIAILVIGDLILLYKLHQKTTYQEKSKEILRKDISNILERVNVELVDYNNFIKDDNISLNELNSFLANLRVNDYLHTNNERNIRIGDENGRT